MPSDGSPFAPEVVRAVTAHMNDDHAEDTLLICRALGGVPEASAARMTGLDDVAAEYTADVHGEQVPVRIPWSHRLTERAEIRREVVRMYEEACRELGMEPRAEH